MQKIKKCLKNRLQDGEKIFGVWNSIPSPSLSNVIASSGVDFVIIDAEHGPISMETAEDMVRAVEAGGSVPIIRVSSNEDYLILRALDIGAHGVQIPHISSATDADIAVKSARYYPEGKRGFSPFMRAGNYGKDPEGYTDRANKKTLVVLNVEGQEGIDNMEDIASIPGIDVIFIGPYDLSQSLGIPGKVRDKKVLEAIRRCVKITDKKGISCGSFACDKEYLSMLIGSGVRYLTYMVDAAVVAGAYREIYDFFKKTKKRKQK
jgi:4-hydroxy-2-oxoheptanedioate aldolase